MLKCYPNQTKIGLIKKLLDLFVFNRHLRCAGAASNDGWPLLLMIYDILCQCALHTFEDLHLKCYFCSGFHGGARSKYTRLLYTIYIASVLSASSHFDKHFYEHFESVSFFSQCKYARNTQCTHAQTLWKKDVLKSLFIVGVLLIRLYGRVDVKLIHL